MVVEMLIRKEPKEFTIKNNIIVGNELKSTETRGIAQILWDSLSETPDFVAQINVDTGETTTFAEIKDRSTRCALWLRKQGIGQNDVISISTPNDNDDLIPYLATLFVGAIFNPWYHELTEVNARRFFRAYRPRIMFACERSIDRLSRLAACEGIDCRFVAYAAAGRHPEYPSLRGLASEQSPAEVASFECFVPSVPSAQCGIVLFSSGTTGTPKGTMLSYESLAIASDGLVDQRQTNRLWYSSMSWITGALFVLVCIRTRALRIIHGCEFDVEQTSKVIEKYKVNWTMLTPSMLIQCCKAKVFDRYDYSSLEELATGGSKLSRTILEEAQRALPHCLVANAYGMTELCGLAARQSRDRKSIDSVGYVACGVKLKIIDTKTGRPLGPNQQGEICVSKRNVLLGYYGNAEETARTLDREGWVHTGDLGYYDEDGEITVTDRIKQLIITRNHHVSPSEIEDILLGHPAVMDCAVVAVPHDVDVERPFAFVVKLPGAKVTAEELKDLPVSYNEYYRLSGGVAFVDDLIYTSSGKKNLQLLKDKAREFLIV